MFFQQRFSAAVKCNDLQLPLSVAVASAVFVSSVKCLILPRMHSATGLSVTHIQANLSVYSASDLT